MVDPGKSYEIVGILVPDRGQRINVSVGRGNELCDLRIVVHELFQIGHVFVYQIFERNNQSLGTVFHDFRLIEHGLHEKVGHLAGIAQSQRLFRAVHFIIEYLEIKIDPREFVHTDKKFIVFPVGIDGIIAGGHHRQFERILIFFLDDGIERIVIHDVLDGLLLFAGSKHTCDGGDRQTDAERYGQFSEFFHFELLFYINLSKIRP